jgi:hypothetical protein
MVINRHTAARLHTPISLLTHHPPVVQFSQQTRQASALRNTLNFGGFLFFRGKGGGRS